MKLYQFVISSFIVLFFCACASTIHKKPEIDNTLVFLGENNEVIVWYGSSMEQDTIADLPDSLSIHSLAFENENKIVYSTSSKSENFAILIETGDTLRCPCNSMDDEYIASGIVGSDSYKQIELYTDTVYAVSIDSGQSWIDKIVRFEATDKKKVKITTQFYSSSGKFLSKKDSSYTCEYVDFNDRGYNCQEDVFDRETMYSQSEKNDNTYYFTRNGSLYKMTDGKEQIFLEYTKNFEYKFGRGFFHPTINYDGTIIFVNYSESGLYSPLDKTPADIVKINMQTKDTLTLSKGNFIHPQFSPNGIFCSMILQDIYHGNHNSEIYVYDVKKSKFIKLGAGSSPMWLGLRHRYY